MKATAHAYMMIRNPPRAVLEAFINPAQLTRFWLKNASGPLERDKDVTWTFMVPGAVAPARMKSYEPGRALEIGFGEGDVAAISVQERADGSTRIDIRNEVSAKTPEEAQAKVNDATSGYSIVLCNLKVLLETGRSANLVEDQAKLIAEDGKPKG
jgi:uncharacterized protein YndB with AHSA1/START domain